MTTLLETKTNWRDLAGVTDESLPRSFLSLITAEEWELIGQHYGVHPDDFKNSLANTKQDGPDPGFTLVMDGLYLGNQVEVAHWGLLRRLGITHVVNVAAQLDPAYPSRICYKWVKIYDNEREKKAFGKHLDDLTEFIHSVRTQNGRVFVHCQSGISRSPTVILAYLLRFHSMDYDSAYHFLKAKRVVTRPNPAFKQLLVEYEHTLKTACTPTVSVAQSETTVSVAQSETKA